MQNFIPAVCVLLMLKPKHFVCLLEFAFQFNRLTRVRFRGYSNAEIFVSFLLYPKRTLLCFALSDRPSMRINIVCQLGCLVRGERERGDHKTFFCGKSSISFGIQDFVSLGRPLIRFYLPFLWHFINILPPI